MELVFTDAGEFSEFKIDPVAILGFGILVLNTWMTREALREAVMSKFESIKLRDWILGTRGKSDTQ